MTKKKIHKLIVEFENDFKLVGIASHENDYRLSWAINKALGLELVKIDDLEIDHPKHKINITFSRYHYFDENGEMDYNLISNKSENGFLIPKIKNIDFIMKISGDPDDSNIQKVMTVLKKIDIIITAFLIDDLPDNMNKLFAF
jgi:hypothetical protein